MNTQEEIVIAAALVPDEERMEFLPSVFGRLMMEGESRVYTWAEELSLAYQGGYWEFYRLSNGGFYMAPAGEKKYHVSHWGNQVEADIGADAFGVVACLYALNQMAANHVGSLEYDGLATAYHALRDFVSGHPEASAIYRLID